MRGITIFETLLALAVGGIVIASSTQGVVKYNENIKVQASAALLKKMKGAADLYATDHYDDLVSNAPQTIPINLLEPYLGSTIRTDPFKSEYTLATRTYTYQTPDPATGGVSTQNALQLLLVATSDGVIDTQLDTDPSIRADIANTAGADAGFISAIEGLCQSNVGASMPVGSLCGAYGAYSFPQGAFQNLDANARYAALITKGDSSVYGDQLYRYNLGDPELNTMHTALNMDGNDIINATTIRNNELLEMEGFRARVRNNSGELSVTASGNLFLGSETNTTVLTNDGSTTYPRIISPTQGIQLGTSDNDVTIGDQSTDSIVSAAESVNSSVTIASGDLLSGRIFGDEARLKSINSLHKIQEDPLRLQDFQRGEVVVGQRARYTPPVGTNGVSPNYELSDGQLTTGVLRSQDVTCADCGGNLSEILPRWRHMGTYFINDTHSGQTVPKPECGLNRRDVTQRAAVGDEQSYSDGVSDSRYIRRILILPKQVVKTNEGDGASGFDIEFYAIHQGENWLVFTGKNDDRVRAEAFAMTYCVFTGGSDSQLDPSNPGYVSLNTRTDLPNGGTWTVLP